VSAFGDSAFGGRGLPTPSYAKPSRAQRRQKPSGGGRGPFGLVGNLLEDVKDAVVGLPQGLVEMASSQGKDIWSAAHGDLDFDRSRKLYGGIASSMWQTWSPLAQAVTPGGKGFTEGVSAFAKQTYDHPLAPLLDVATVFTGGTAGAVKGAQALSKAGVGGARVAKVAKLDEGRTLQLSDPAGKGRRDMPRYLSERPGRRVLQETLLAKDRYMPQWYVTGKNRRQYEHEWSKHEAGENAAKNLYTQTALQALAILQSGKTLSSPGRRLDAYTAVFSSMAANLAHHAPEKLAEGPASFAKSDHRRYLRQMDDAEIRGHFERATKAGLDPDQVLANFGRHTTTRSQAKAMRNEKGELLVITKGDAWKLGDEAVKSSKLAKAFYHNPTVVWKSVQVAWAPRTIINNGVGNWLIFAMRQGGHNSIRGVFDAVRLAKGERAAKKMLGSEKGFDNWASSLRNKHFGDEAGNTFGAELGLLSDKGGRLKRRARTGFHDIVHKTSEQPVRDAAMAAYLRGNKEVKAFQEQGMKFEDAADAALTANRELRDRTANHIRTIAGDYRTVKSWEKGVRDLIPFYLWNKHIAKSTGNMVLDTPGRVAVAARISQMGIEETEEFLGNIPEFLRGVVPLGKDGKRADVLLTHSLNPFATIGELADATKAFLVGDSARGGATLLGQANPFITGGFEAATGRDILTGAPVESKGGILSSVLYNTGMQVPPAQLAQALVEKTASKGETGKPFLYEHGNAKTTALSLLGVPTRSVSLERAGELHRKEHGITTRRERRYKPPAFKFLQHNTF
jgi:hypothetical protein